MHPLPTTGGQSYCEFVYCAFVLGEGNYREERGWEIFLRSKRRRHLPKIRTFKKIGQIFFLDRQTDKQTLWFTGKVHFQKVDTYGTVSLSNERFVLVQVGPFKNIFDTIKYPREKTGFNLYHAWKPGFKKFSLYNMQYACSKTFYIPCVSWKRSP